MADNYTKKQTVVALFFALAFVFNSNFVNAEGGTPYTFFVTSMGCDISSTPLLDVSPATVGILNASPFNGIALGLVDVYSGQPIANESTVVAKANQLKSISNKTFWPMIGLNRMLQRESNNAYYEAGHTKAEVAGFATHGLTCTQVAKASTPYFAAIKRVDIYDAQGALTDFLTIWRRALQFSKVQNSGIIYDPENYHYTGGGMYNLADVAAAQGKTEAEVISRLKEIGHQMADIALEENPDVEIVSFFTNDDSITWYTPYTSFIFEGILERAKQNNMSLKLYDGGEGELEYVNSVAGLKTKIASRPSIHTTWLNTYPRNFGLAGTITVWDNLNAVSGWALTDCQSRCGTPCPYTSLNDFKPHLTELFKAYHYTWFYCPMVTDYKPFGSTAPAWNQKLGTLLATIYQELLANCTPTNCSALGYTCGIASNGCSGTLSCGNCSAGYACSANRCVAASTTTSSTTSTTASSTTTLLGPVLYLAFDEGTGTTAHDSSGLGNDGTLSGGPAWVNGRSGKAVGLDGLDDYVQVGNSSTLSVSDNITIAAWIKPAASQEYCFDGTKGNYGVMVSIDSFTDRNSWSWQLRYGAPTGCYLGVQFHTSGGGQWVTVGQNLTTGEWYHVAATYDGSQARSYLNGELRENKTMPAVAADASNKVFVGVDGWGDYFNGSVDDVRIYRRSLSATEINQLYAAATTTTSTSTMSVRIPGDADGDGHVDYSDLIILAASYDKQAGESGYDPRADYNGDGLVGYEDLIILAANYGT